MMLQVWHLSTFGYFTKSSSGWISGDFWNIIVRWNLTFFILLFGFIAFLPKACIHNAPQILFYWLPSLEWACKVLSSQCIVLHMYCLFAHYLSVLWHACSVGILDISLSQHLCWHQSCDVSFIVNWKSLVSLSRLWLVLCFCLLLNLINSFKYLHLFTFVVHITHYRLKILNKNMLSVEAVMIHDIIYFLRIAGCLGGLPAYDADTAKSLSRILSPLKL